MTIICVLLSVYFWILFIRILSSWFPPPRSEPLRSIWRLLYDLTDPVLRPLRNFIPPLRLGAVALDLSPILVFVILGVIQAAIGCGTVGL